VDRKYHYRAKAVAFSGSLVRPLAIDLGELAKTELVDGDGGYHSARLENHRLHEILSVSAAYTQVTASEGPEGHFNTLAIATVENLNILDIVKVDRITARLVALHCAADFEQCQRPWIIPLGSTIENLRVGGRHYDVPHPEGFLHDFAKPHSYEKWKANQQHCLSAGETFEVPRFGKVTHCKLEAVPFEDSGKQHHLHRLVMLNLEMGSPVQGVMRFGTADVDGSPPQGL
jgi:hypothetical protein